MPSMDIFNDDAFSVQSLTAAINKRGYRPGQISASGLFNEDGVTTTIVSIEEKDGNLSLVEPTPRGGPGETVGGDRRKMIPFAIPHYERNDAVYADEVQNVRAFGSESDVEMIEDRVNEKTARHAQDLTMTLEHQRIGAIKGIVGTKSGAIITNLYTAFGIAVPSAISLELDVDATKVGGLVYDVKSGIEDSLDAPYTGMRAYTGQAFHKALWNHPAIVDTFKNTAAAGTLRQDIPDSFEFGGITWERYRTGVKATADLAAAYISANDAYVVVTGVPDLFITRFAPADYMETVNTKGLPFYTKQFPTPNDKGRNLEVQMNPLSLCTRPGTLRRLTLT